MSHHPLIAWGVYIILANRLKKRLQKPASCQTLENKPYHGNKTRLDTFLLFLRDTDVIVWPIFTGQELCPGPSDNSRCYEMTRRILSDAFCYLQSAFGAPSPAFGTPQSLPGFQSSLFGFTPSISLGREGEDFGSQSPSGSQPSFDPLSPIFGAMPSMGRGMILV